jgi:hypothetical protein
LDIEGFVSINDIASGPGLLRGIADNPHGMGFFDEVTSLFRRATTKGGSDTIADGKSDALLDIYSRSGQTLKKSYGDKKNTIVINNPCFSLLGNATPAIFDAIQLKDFETGLMQRFDFWTYDGPILPKKLCNNQYYKKTREFIQRLNEIMQTRPPEINVATLVQGVPLQATDKAMIHIDEYSRYIVEMANKEESSGMVGIMSRKFDLSLKYALIHHAASRKPERLFSAVDEDDIRYGIMIAELLAGWKMNVLTGKVVSGDFHRDCEIFKDAIKKVVQRGKKNPTFKLLADRKVNLKNWDKKYSQSIIDVLKKRGEIITRELNGTTRYYLPKEYKND